MPNRFHETLECGHCGLEHSAHEVQTTCRNCEGPLLSRYDLAHPDLPTLADVEARPPGQLRFHEVLPLGEPEQAPTLGEGATPLVAAPRLPGEVLIKDEAQNPTGSFKARGMAVAMARAVELGLTSFVVPSNGNAGGAAAAYGAIHGVDVVVFVPRATPEPLIREARAHGATVELVEGTIATAGQAAARQAEENGSFNLATLREPYRVEGKKMMGYEVLWDLGHLPDVIVYPTGGG
ncbi:MAG: pyridoxal-phosphate dependent enzyme, partial [Acidimicrobiia bacterium]|nr:pyridoxal-phosphate dependent enzyme [Acidimicrobiia bacterium]